MSHFTEMKVEFLVKNERDLITALENLFGEGKVEVHDSPKELKLWNGGSSLKQTKASGLNAPECHVIVRKETMEKKAGRMLLTNDLGYRRNEQTGKFECYADKAGFSKPWSDQVAQDYAAIVSTRKLKAQGYAVKRVQLDDGRIQLKATKFS